MIILLVSFAFLISSAFSATCIYDTTVDVNVTCSATGTILWTTSSAVEIAFNPTSTVPHSENFCALELLLQFNDSQQSNVSRFFSPSVADSTSRRIYTSAYLRTERSAENLLPVESSSSIRVLVKQPSTGSWMDIDDVVVVLDMISSASSSSSNVTMEFSYKFLQSASDCTPISTASDISILEEPQPASDCDAVVIPLVSSSSCEIVLSCAAGIILWPETHWNNTPEASTCDVIVAANMHSCFSHYHIVGSFTPLYQAMGATVSFHDAADGVDRSVANGNLISKWGATGVPIDVKGTMTKPSNTTLPYYAAFYKLISPVPSGTTLEASKDCTPVVATLLLRDLDSSFSVSKLLREDLSHTGTCFEIALSNVHDGGAFLKLEKYSIDNVTMLPNFVVSWATESDGVSQLVMQSRSESPNVPYFTKASNYGSKVSFVNGSAGYASEALIQLELKPCTSQCDVDTLQCYPNLPAGTCLLDQKLCSDGTHVLRKPPLCEFPKCKETNCRAIGGDCFACAGLGPEKCQFCLSSEGLSECVDIGDNCTANDARVILYGELQKGCTDICADNYEQCHGCVRGPAVQNAPCGWCVASSGGGSCHHGDASGVSQAFGKVSCERWVYSQETNVANRPGELCDAPVDCAGFPHCFDCIEAEGHCVWCSGEDSHLGTCTAIEDSCPANRPIRADNCKDLGLCTLDVLGCADGSFVGRDPNNNCEFKPCKLKPSNAGAIVAVVIVLFVAIFGVIVAVWLWRRRRRPIQQGTVMLDDANEEEDIDDVDNDDDDDDTEDLELDSTTITTSTKRSGHSKARATRFEKV